MTGVFFDAEPYPAGAYRDRTPLMHVIRHEGTGPVSPETEGFLQNAAGRLERGRTSSITTADHLLKFYPIRRRYRSSPLIRCNRRSGADSVV